MQSAVRSLENIIPVLNTIWSMNAEGKESLGRHLANHLGIPFTLRITMRNTDDL